ncbi:malto-oligosyltrehalose synthase [Sphingomonas bacterium]|uniref:malto-oligosyltrehalose synthase n=1 Tax=Sphingomonas bacterium TaxID=1895847 RepID=UPI001575B470|nr:malto-oligosyltrehalose synthase [Sphingomonas bacterium]
MTVPRATYRLQLRPGFTFADAEALVPYLDDLGISHVYASPIATATSGSAHGYDVVDPTRIGPELGGEAGFRSLVAALRARGMGMVVDIVPNHMGIAGGENPWWEDVLARGQASRWAPVFDIDWRRPVLLPVLRDPPAAAIAGGDLTLVRDAGRWSIALGDRRFPVRDEDQADAGRIGLSELLDRQHYRLAVARVADDELNWRRFFTVNDLVGVRVEDPAVFEATHALHLRLYEEGLVDGFRVDHVDGLTDPAGYCRKLRARLDAIRPGAWLVVEKILKAGEPLASDWGLDGTSGYDFMEQVSELLHDPAGEAPLGELWHAVSGRSAAFPPEELLARREMLSWSFGGQLAACVEAFSALVASGPIAGGVSDGMLRRAIERLLWVFPVYRTYGTGDTAPAFDAPVRVLARERALAFAPPGEAGMVDLILAWLAGGGTGDPARAAEAVRRFQQLSTMIAAKAVEDTAFYRHGRLLSRTEVGSDPARFACAVGAFHAAMATRAGQFPHAMLATATHDHKHGEDMRARLSVLSGIPAQWAAAIARWRRLAAAALDPLDPGDRYMLLQTLFGAWPDGLSPSDPAGLAAYAGRVIEWQRKALREAKLRSSWPAPDEAYEARCADAARTLLDADRSPGFLTDLAAFLNATASATLAVTLVQTVLRLTTPGVPDCYQGTELVDFSLVDPDNRRPVDYRRRRALLVAGGDDKLDLIARLLALRRADPALFAQGGYRPLTATGARAGHVIAFERRLAGRTLRLVAALRCAAPLLGQGTPVPPRAWWGDTAVGRGMPVADLLADAPVWLDMSTPG